MTALSAWSTRCRSSMLEGRRVIEWLMMMSQSLMSFGQRPLDGSQCGPVPIGEPEGGIDRPPRPADPAGQARHATVAVEPGQSSEVGPVDFHSCVAQRLTLRHANCQPFFVAPRNISGVWCWPEAVNCGCVALWTARSQPPYRQSLRAFGRHRDGSAVLTPHANSASPRARSVAIWIAPSSPACRCCGYLRISSGSGST